MTLAQLRSLFRELTGESDTTVVADSTIDLYLQRALEALNRRVGYYFVTANVTWAGADGRYDLPTDFVAMVWCYWLNTEVHKGDLEHWRRNYENWRTEQDTPLEYYIEGNEILFRPIPTAESVAESATAEIRYIANPPSITDTAAGPLGLLHQDRSIPVYWAVVLWSAAHPDGPLAQWRIEHFSQLFKDEVAAVQSAYEARRLQQ